MSAMYLTIFHQLHDSDESLMKFLNYGGLPGLRQVGLESDEHVWAYLSSVSNTIMLKDIIVRHPVWNRGKTICRIYQPLF